MEPLVKRKKYSKLSDHQKDVLQRYYNEGMTSLKPSFTEQINKAAEEAGLSIEKVKQWIGNQRYKLKKQSTGGAELENPGSESAAKKVSKLPALLKPPTSYNLFSAEVFRSEECKELTNLAKRNKLVSSKWASLTQEEKESYKGANVREVNIANLDDAAKENLKKKYVKQLQSIVYFLEDLGCITSILALDDNSVSALGCTEGQRFLMTNQEVILKFRQHFAVPDAGNATDTFKEVQMLFNSKYSDAVGKPSRVPYSKGGFKVVGLPVGIPFRKPTGYGAVQVQKIMAEKDNIQFILVNNESAETPLATCSTSSESATYSEMPNARNAKLPVIDLLSNLVDREVAEKAVLESRLIEEQQLEVLNLSISYDQLLLLISMARKYFDLDAWVTLGKNLCSFLSQDQNKGIVVPCYTDETPDEPYWLFYIPNKSISFLLSLTPKKVIRGYWMDVSKNGGDYVLLHEHLQVISGQNIIVCNNGIPLYIQLALSIETGVSLSLPKGFHNAVLSAIRSHGHTHV